MSPAFAVGWHAQAEPLPLEGVKVISAEVLPVPIPMREPLASRAVDIGNNHLRSGPELQHGMCFSQNKLEQCFCGFPVENHAIVTMIFAHDGGVYQK